MSDLDQQIVEQATASWAPQARYFEEIDSTNREAHQWAVLGAPEGCVVVAGKQTAGRGRLDRTWFSPPDGSLSISIILRPRVDMQEWGILSLLAGSALAEALEEIEVPARLKWPNDVLVNELKVAGILSQAVILPGIDHTAAVILGVGVNVNIDEFPPELTGAGSLSTAMGRRFDRADILVRFLHRFGLVYAGFPAVSLDGYRRLCDTIGRRVRVETAEGTHEAVATSVADSGGLVLDNGLTVSAGDVVHLR